MITIIQTTSDKKEEVEAFAKEFVTTRLAACCQIDQPVSSLNHWEGDIESTTEYRLTIKTTDDHLEAIKAYITEHHSYDLPEIVWHEVQTTPEYEAWLKAEVAGNSLE